MLKNRDINEASFVSWIVVKDSTIWLQDGKLPEGTASELNLP
ncbi:hypothetical protein JCM19233_3903 [Vibrio astriarenae]|nr:hypothetical protein JCM19233_3903 [Vibrio sp. C7]